MSVAWRKKKKLADELGTGMKVKISKKQLAVQMGVSRSSLYYQPKLPEKDWLLKQRIEAVLHEHPSYGHKRIALDLKINKKRILRVMKKFGIKPYRRRPKRPRKKKDQGQNVAPYTNRLLEIPAPSKPHAIWVSDFTYLRFKNRFIYLATVMDIYTRLVVGSCVLTAHRAELVKNALIQALLTGEKP